MLLAGCELPAAPEPFQIPSGQPRDLPAHATPAALLEVASFDIVPTGVRNGVYGYLPSVTLRETSGQSAAHLLGMEFLVSIGGNTLVVGDEFFSCLPASLSKIVPANGTWSTAGIASYCLGLSSSVALEGLPVEVNVGYTDDDGTWGTFRAAALVTAATP